MEYKISHYIQLPLQVVDKTDFYILCGILLACFSTNLLFFRFHFSFLPFFFFPVENLFPAKTYRVTLTFFLLPRFKKLPFSAVLDGPFVRGYPKGATRSVGFRTGSIPGKTLKLCRGESGVSFGNKTETNKIKRSKSS